MNTFMGIENVIKVEPILNKFDGIADGFSIYYTLNGKVKKIEKWVRSYYDTPEYIDRESSKKQKRVVVKKMSKEEREERVLSLVSRIIGER